MRKIAVDEAERFDHPATDTLGGHRVSEALGATDVGINYYELDPGETFSGGFHTHHDQEEIFYVLDGTATFETVDGPVTVEAGEVIRFEPGEFQHGHNESGEPVVGLAIGAPSGSRDVEVLMECPACGELTYHRRPSLLSEGVDPEVAELDCPECGTSTAPAKRPG